MRRLLPLLLGLPLALSSTAARAHPPIERSAPAHEPASLARPISIHELELRAHATDPPRRPTPSARTSPDAREPAGRRSVRRSQQLVRAVYGYYPFWVQDLAALRWEGLTHLAWFSVEIDGEGQITAAHGWPDAETVSAAHAGDVRVELTFTLFDNAAIGALCASPARRAATATTMIDAMEQGDADGISVDFEFVPASARADFVTFVAELRDALDARGHPDAGITLALPEVDWSDAIDLAGLLEHADYAFLMGYGFFWSGSSYAGPPGLLRVAGEYGPVQSWSTIRSIASYSRQISAAQRRQVIWGVPYYGREWITDSGAVASSVVDHVGAVTYTAAREDLAAGRTRQWHDGIASPYYRWQESGAWRQVYYEDEQSLAAKYELALDQDLGGVGMWALNYDTPHAELWDLLEQTFVAEPPSEPGERHAPLAIASFPFHDERDTSEGPSSYFNYYSCAPDTPEYGREWVYRIDLCQSGTLTATVPAYADRDPDLHLLSGPTQQECLARAHTALESTVTPGAYWLVLDTFVDLPIELEGPTTLDVDFVADPGSEPCAAHLVCAAGSCQCPTEGEVDCGGECVTLETNPDHCGDCNHPCESGEACVQGSCSNAGEGGAAGAGTGGGAAGHGGSGGGASGSLLAPAEDDGGCGCRLGARSDAPGRAWLLVLGGMLVRRRAGRRCGGPFVLASARRSARRQGGDAPGRAR